MDESLLVAKLKLQSKSMLIGLLLTFFFGGFGVFYFSTWGGVICSILEILLWIIAFFTFGFGAILLIPAHLIFVIYTAISINRHNKKLLETYN